LKLGTVKIKEFEWQKEVYGYVSIPGVFPFKKDIPKRLSVLKSQDSELEGVSEGEALVYLKNYLGVEDKSLSKWIDKVINDKIYRLRIHEILKSKSIKPQNPNWEVLETCFKGDLII
jgi:hypothetical protein